MKTLYVAGCLTKTTTIMCLKMNEDIQHKTRDFVLDDYLFFKTIWLVFGMKLAAVSNVRCKIKFCHVYDGPMVNYWQNILDLGGWSEMMMQQHPTHFDPEHGDSIFSGMLTFHLQVMVCYNPEDHILNLKTCHLCYHFSILLNDPSTDFMNCAPVNLGYIVSLYM